MKRRQKNPHNPLWRPSRRAFIQGLGGSLVGLPLLHSLTGARAAGTGTMPKRIIFFYTPNGLPAGSWWPTPGVDETDFTLNTTHAPLSAHKNDLLLLQGINLAGGGPGGPHARGMGTALTGAELQEGMMASNNGQKAGWADGISVDQHIANYHAGATLFPSLQVGVRADNYQVTNMSRLSYSGPGTALPPDSNPKTLWQTLFPGAPTMDPPDPDPPPPVIPKTAADYQLSVLDTVQDQFGALQPTLGIEDRVRLDAHLTMVREVERRLQSLQPPPPDPMDPPPPDPPETPPVCDGPFEPVVEDVNGDGTPDHDSDVTMAEVADIQLELVALALACDLTRVVTFQFGNAWDRVSFPMVGTTDTGHNLSHSGTVPGMAYWGDVALYQAGQLNKLINRLKTIEEGDGCVFDSCAIVWISDVAVGSTHSILNMPYLIAGSLGGTFRTGRFIQYPGLNHNDLLVSLMNGMDVPGASFGKTGLSTGGLTGLT